MTNQYKSNAQLKDMAKDALTGNYPIAICTIVLLHLLTNSVTFLTLMVTPTSGVIGAILSFIVTLAVSIVLGVFSLGLNLFFLNMACRRPCSVQDLFYGFRFQSKEALVVSAVLVTLNTLCMTPYERCLQQFLSTQDNKWLLYAALAVAIGTLLYTILSLYLSQAYFLLLDFPGKSGAEALKLSRQVMKGSKMRLFLLQLGFVPLMFLCLLSFGIGFLWLTPYMNMTMTQFYLDLMKPKAASNA